MRTTPLALLVALLTACSSDSPDDTLDDDGAGSSESGEPGGTGEDEGSSSGEESTGEPVSEWPPECVAAGECGAVEGLLDAGACEEDGLRIEGVELAWGTLDGDGGVIVAGSAVGECGDPLRWIYDEPVYLNAYSLALTWASDDGAWRCAVTRTDIDPGELTLGAMGQLEVTGPYTFPSDLGASSCCQLEGDAVDGLVQTPC